MCLVWGTTWYVIREGLEHMEPLGSAGLRFAVASLIMVPIAGSIGRREGGTAPTPRLIAAMALGNFSISYGIVYWSEQTLPSSLAAVLWGIYPILTALIAHVYLPGSRIQGSQWMGLFVGFLGVLLLFFTDIRAVGGDALLRGSVLLISPVVSAFGTLYIKKHGGGVSSALLNRAALVSAAVILLTVAYFVEGRVVLPTEPRAVGSIVYLAGMGTVLTFTLYLWILRTSSAVSLSLIAYVNPAIALLIGAGIGEEPVTAWTLSGLALILTGCAFVLRKPGTKQVAPQALQPAGTQQPLPDTSS
ncbi:putative inner membrane transporter YedA [Planctomycetes bacterium Poly30]|uniref:Putative inner membrane transporter YedA n=2 Tax=Saltatorellus ferox TaxID=2528018 RepID=A0A518ESI4_9BACT|nr:putative inner membrane transporter YedA [Planctomycetes bacterium Poly30]